MRVLTALMALAVVGFAGTATAADTSPAGTPPLMRVPYAMLTVKINVADFDKSADFYSKYIGMKKGQKFNDHELEMTWTKQGQATDIILLHDDTGKAMKPGPSWLVIKVPDAHKVAKHLADDGYKGVQPITEPKGSNVAILMVDDPDGNRLELIEALPPMKQAVK